MKTATAFLLLASAAAAAGPAAAQDIRVSVAGKSPAAVAADIHRAAKTVCTSAMFAGDVGFFDLNSCVRAVGEDSLDRARAVRAANPPQARAAIPRPA